MRSFSYSTDTVAKYVTITYLSNHLKRVKNYSERQKVLINEGKNGKIQANEQENLFARCRHIKNGRIVDGEIAILNFPLEFHFEWKLFAIAPKECRELNERAQIVVWMVKRCENSNTDIGNRICLFHFVCLVFFTVAVIEHFSFHFLCLFASIWHSNSSIDSVRSVQIHDSMHTQVKKSEKEAKG